ncbi:MAG: hypothetical protein HON04_17400 [Planctomicrobium sp.]|nr:hypothetical protein [Planctomicrobium sp.]
MNRFRKVIRVGLSVTAAIYAVVFLDTSVAVSQDHNQIDANWTKSSLSLGDQSRKCLNHWEGWQTIHANNRLRIQSHKNKIREVDLNGDVAWTLQVKQTNRLDLLCENMDVLYLYEYRLDEYGFKQSTEGPLRVKRIDSSGGEWLADFMIPLTEPELQGSSTVYSATPVGTKVVCFSFTEEETDSGMKPMSYRVTCIEDETQWSKSFPVSGKLPEPGAFLFGSLGPSRDNSGIRNLTPFEDDLIVCGGPLEDVMRLSMKTGETVWRIPRLWEFRRGFTGPSVWEHHIGRYGLDFFDSEYIENNEDASHQKDIVEPETPESAKYLKAIKKRAAKLRKRVEVETCWIVAGPVVVPWHGEDRFNDEVSGSSIFVITSRSEDRAWPGYLADCVVYEIDKEGKVLGRSILPDFVRGNSYQVQTNSVFWKLTGEVMLNLIPGMGSWLNHRCKVTFESRRLPTSEKKKAWMRQGRLYDFSLFHNNEMLRLQQGGYLETSEDNEFKIPLTIVNLSNHSVRNLTLKIPFEGDVYPPGNNYSKTGNEWTVYSEFMYMLKSVELLDQRIVFYLKRGEGQHALEFSSDGVFQSE